VIDVKIKIGGTKGKSFEFDGVKQFTVTESEKIRKVTIKKDNNEHKIALSSEHVVIKVDND
jgi:hypothetical protein